MKRLLQAALVLLLMALAYLAGTWNREWSAGASNSKERKILYYHDPMHPAYTSDKPGIAPDCGMQLEPVYAGGAGPVAGSDAPSSLPPGILEINPAKQQLMGVRVSPVEKAPRDHTIRILGRVVPDETRVVRLTAADGWVQTVEPRSAASVVRKGDLLATFYSKDFLSAQQSYLFGVNLADKRAKSDQGTAPEPVQVALGQKELRSLGMSDLQIDEISRTHRAATDIELRAPITGFVLARNMNAGMKFDKGTELYRIADLSRVWILADLFESEAPYFRPGIKAKVSLSHGEKIFTALVSDVLPAVDPATRTLKVRLEIENPGYTLRPDMFVDVELPVQLPPALTVPSDAVLDTGLQKRVFVDLGNGRFEARKVETGWRFDDRVQIVKGLKEGERIVVSGNFLLDSESRMRAAAAGVHSAPDRDPVCGMTLDQNKARSEGKTSTVGGREYYFCSDLCKKSFDKEPARFASHESEASEKRAE